MVFVLLSNMLRIVCFLQFDLDENYGVFCVDISSGKLTHYQSQKIKVSFDPPFPGIYYRRAVLLVHEQVNIKCIETILFLWFLDLLIFLLLCVS